MAKRVNFSKEEIKDICESYKNGEPRKKIAKRYNHTDKVIVRVLQENNIEIRRTSNFNNSKLSNRTYKINDNYFDIHNQSHNSAYILGMLASDGCVAKSQNQIYIELQRQDKEILEKINSEIQNERPVKDYENHSKGTKNSKLYFFSMQIKKDLSLYNIIPNKTNYNLDFLRNIEPKYYIDFIRGFFDGDGSIKWSNGTISWQIDSTSLATLEHIQKVLKEYDIHSKITKKSSIVNLQIYRLYFYNYENGLKLYKLFYKLPSTKALRMQRKYLHYTELLLKYSSHEASDLISEQ